MTRGLIGCVPLHLTYVLSGRGKFWVNGEDTPVSVGSTLFVAAEEPHRFHTIEEDLSLLVFFAPPEADS